MLVTILACIGVLLITIWLMGKKKHEGFEPPILPGGLPILGHALMFLGNGEDFWKLIKEVSYYTLKVGGSARIFVLTKPFYLITDSDDFVTVMTTCYEKFFIKDFVKEWVGDGLESSDVITWKRDRKLFGPAFTQRALVCFLDIFNEQSRKLVEQLAVEVGKGEFDHLAYVSNNILETVNQTTLGLKSEDNKMLDINYSEEVDRVFDTVIERLQKIWLWHPFFFNRSDLKKQQDKFINKTKALSYEVIKKRKLEYKENKNIINENYGKGKTVVDYILENFVETENFTDENIREHLETFLIGSFRTTGTQIVLTLKAIGPYPEMQEKIFKELQDVFGESDRDVNKEDLPKLIYLEAVIKETLRLYPIAPIIARDTHIDVKLKNYTIPRGSTCIGLIYGVNRQPAWGRDADEFRPERWLSSDRPSEKFFTSFSVGKRNCIGAHYAMIVMKTMLVHIFRRYLIKSDKTEPVIKWNAHIRPLSGYYIALESRT